jgi:hypothetical protein
VPTLRLDRPSILLAWLAGMSVLSWPMALVRTALAVPFHGRSGDVSRAAGMLTPVVCASTVIIVAWLCRRGRTGARDFLKAGGIGGLVLGGALFSVCEVLHGPQDTLIQSVGFCLKVELLGGFWAAPIAVPVGAMLGLTVWAMARVLGAALSGPACEQPC